MPITLDLLIATGARAGGSAAVEKLTPHINIPSLSTIVDQPALELLSAPTNI